jgi:cell division transport system permease protein
MAALLLVISYALISNTVRLTVYANRFSIHTMKLVGATAGFIRKPFIQAQIFSGIIAALAAIALLSGALIYISGRINEIWEIIDKTSLYIAAGSMLVLGILISSVAAYFAVNRYLRIEEGDLFYI